MGENMAGTNVFAFFRCGSIRTGGGGEGQNRAEKKVEKCLPAGTSTKIYFSRIIVGAPRNAPGKDSSEVFGAMTGVVLPVHPFPKMRCTHILQENEDKADVRVPLHPHMRAREVLLSQPSPASLCNLDFPTGKSQECFEQFMELIAPPEFPNNKFWAEVGKNYLNNSQNHLQSCISRFVLQGRKVKIIKIVKNRVPGHPEKMGGKAGQKCRIFYIFDLLYPQFVSMAWNPIFDYFNYFDFSAL